MRLPPSGPRKINLARYRGRANARRRLAELLREREQLLQQHPALSRAEPMLYRPQSRWFVH